MIRIARGSFIEMGNSFRPSRKQNTAAAVGLAAILALGGFVAVGSAHRSGEQFPGFFVDTALNVSLLSLPGWPHTAGGWPSVVTRADGVAIESAAQLYSLAKNANPTAPITYETSRLGIAGPPIIAPARPLSGFELAVVFAGLLLNGIIACAVALLVWRNQPPSRGADALLIAGAAVGVFAVTAVSAVGDGALARLNILAQCLAGAGILHLALVFPADVLPRAKSAALFAVYAPFAALALVYQLIWPDPYGSGLLNGVATAATIAASAVLILGILLRLWSRRAVVVRRRAAIATSGIAGMAVVAASWISAAGLDWRALPAALLSSGWLIPLAIGGAIAARDFFALDQRLRGILTYGTAIPAIAVAYCAALYLIGPHAVANGAPVAITLPFLVLNLAMIVAVAPVIRIARHAVDRLFSPESYSVDRNLDNLKRGLSAARTTQTLVGNTIEILQRTLRPARLTVFLRGRGAGFPVYAYDDPEERRIAVPTELADVLDDGEIAFRHQWDEGWRSVPPRLLDRFDADLLVPISRAGSCVGMIALAAKRSGRPYDGRDIAFVRAASDQIALALPNAAAQDRLEILQETLDQLTENLRLQTTRTEALKQTNAELSEALGRLRDTHLELADKQRAILRAEHLTALERLSVALTQELSGPLAAVLVALRGIGRLGKEHAEPIHTPERQRMAIDQMMAHADSGAAWLERAISYLRSFQGLGTAESSAGDRFAVRDAFSEALQLLRPRLRESGCELDYTESPEALELYGSRQRFVLVLVDLIGAAIQAYAEGKIGNGRIEVRAELTAQEICVSVVDWANGLATAAIPQLLDQLASDELIGNRRGLWIAKNLVEEGFGGTLEVSTNDAMTCFTAVLPHRFGKRASMGAPPSLRLAAS